MIKNFRNASKRCFSNRISISQTSKMVTSGPHYSIFSNYKVNNLKFTNEITTKQKDINLQDFEYAKTLAYMQQNESLSAKTNPHKRTIFINDKIITKGMTELFRSRKYMDDITFQNLQNTYSWLFANNVENFNKVGSFITFFRLLYENDIKITPEQEKMLFTKFKELFFEKNIYFREYGYLLVYCLHLNYRYNNKLGHEFLTQIHSFFKQKLDTDKKIVILVENFISLLRIITEESVLTNIVMSQNSKKINYYDIKNYEGLEPQHMANVEDFQDLCLLIIPRIKLQKVFLDWLDCENLMVCQGNLSNIILNYQTFNKENITEDKKLHKIFTQVAQIIRLTLEKIRQGRPENIDNQYTINMIENIYIIKSEIVKNNILSLNNEINKINQDKSLIEFYIENYIHNKTDTNQDYKRALELLCNYDKEI